jgi:hypothetical protein
MPRSADALKRRAEKRNISEKEMRKIDAQPMKKVKSESKPIVRKPKTDSRSMKKWTCKVCTNVNLAHMYPKKCNNCQRPRVEVDEEYVYGDNIIPSQVIDKKPDSHWQCMKCNNKNTTKFFPITCNRCQRDRSSEPEVPSTVAKEESKASDTTTAALLSPTSTSTPTPKKSKSKETLVIEQVSGKKRDRSVDTVPVDPKESDVVPTSSKFWSCSVCNNRNICAIHTLTCNRCCRHRKEVEVKSAAPVSAPVSALVSAPVSAPAQTPAIPSTHWSCTACNNRNIRAVHALTCNRCQRHRSEVELKSDMIVVKSSVDVPPVCVPPVATVTAPKKAAPAVWTCVKCKNKNLLSLNLSACNRCQRARVAVDASAENNTDKKASAEEKKSNSWDTTVVDRALIDKNMKLREAFLNPETCEALSEEDRRRAEVLVERSKRKQEKKEKRNAWKKKIKKR